MAGDAVLQAERYLQPVFKRENFIPAKGASVIDKLFESSGQKLEPGQTRQEVVVDKGLSLLELIHHAISSDPGSATNVLNTSSSRRLIDALLDLISLEGIYPCLLSGVGSPIERRVRSVLQGGVTITDSKTAPDLDSKNLARITQRIYDLVICGRGVAIAIQQRTLVDVIAAMGQLVYSPNNSCSGQWSSQLSQLIDSSTPSILFPSLISLLHHKTPSWLKPFVTVSLSLLPMRPEGVRQTITFVAKSTPQRPMQTTEQPGGSDNGPILPIEVLAQVAEVLSALPSTVPPEEYFKQISPQMIQLLTDKDPDARRAAAYTISHGILNKRRFGQVGAIGWQYFAEPLISVINNSTPDTEPAGSLLHQMQALKALSTLIFAFPNPALSKRLLKPINLPLWAICCLPGGNSVGKDLAMRLLEHYIDSVAGSKGLLTIVDGLMYQGDPGWILQPNLDMDSGETYLDIKPSISKESENLSKIYHIKPRIDRFMRLVDACHDDTEIGLFLANILQRTMRPDSSSLNSESEDILQPVIDANIAKELISTRSSRLKGNIVNIVSVIEEVLANQLSAIQMIQASQDSAVSRSMLATIITHSQHTECSLPVQDLENTLGICLPWLILVAESNAESIHQEIRDDSRSLQSLLSTILSISKLSRASKDAIRLVLSLHTRQESDSNSPAAAYIDQHTKDLELHTIAMNNLMATEPPIRVQGLSQLEALVVCDSPLTSTSAATLTVMSLLSDEDSFVYLSAIKTLTVLVRKDPSPAVKTLQEAYHDVIEQSTIDVRLRMGEVLQTVFEEIGPHLPSTPLKNLVEMLLFLSSRRVYRDKTHTAQSRASALSRAVEADEADSDDESGDAGRKSERDLQSILDSWQGKSGSEDLRIRTSALTLLGTAFEHADFAILSLFIHPSLEVITQIIRLELGQENAIIRRAAVLVVLSIIRGQQNSGRYTSTLMNAEPSGREESIDSITALLGAVAVEDDDPIVRGHAENVIQALREWRENILEALVRGDDIRTGLENQAGDFRLRGLHINPSLHSETGKGKGHKIEEVE